VLSAQERTATGSLSEYYQAADEVLFARLDRVAASGTSRLLRMTVVETPWKTASGRAEALRVEGPVEYLTTPEADDCEIPLELGAVYVMFAAAGGPEPAASGAPGPSLWVSRCSGTRVYVSASGANPQGFSDVPGAFVAAQLDALSGMDALSEFTAAHPDASDPENETLVGMLDLDALAHGGTVPVRERRAPDAPVLAVVASYREVESREVSYEVGAATAFARVDRWTRIRLTDGRFGWVAPDDAGTWFPYGELVTNRLNYLTGAWSGHVWPAPGAGIPARSSLPWKRERQEHPAAVLEAALVGGTLWFRVEILSESPCMDPNASVTLSGWIPAFGVEGEPTAWYYSRGC
jgi:hypothetical protein